MTPKQPVPKQPLRKPTKKDDKRDAKNWAKVAKAKRALYEYWRDQLVGIFDGIYFN